MTILVTLAASQSDAIEVFGNTGISSDGVQIGGSNPITTAVAQGFTFGSGNEFNELESITLALAVNPAGPNLGNLIFAIYSDSGSLPDTEVARFSSTPVGGFINNNAHLYTFNFASGVQTLTANTSYWIVATYDNATYNPATDTPAMNWRDAAPDVAPSAKNSYNISSIGAAARGSGFSAWSASPDNVALRVSLNVVPEPSTYALGLAGTLVLGTIARRRNRLAVTA